MRFSIPVTALIYLLVNSSGTVNSASIAYDDIANNNNNKKNDNFTCNEPFMIPAEYIDSSGNHFAMCLSDPRFHRKRIIWYIQDTNGSDYKALGVAVSKGGGDFVGTVVPIQQPDAGSGMHADPVTVRVRLDRRAGVVTVNPIGLRGKGKLVNWIIKPNGFAPGSLRVPDSCGPFLTALKDPKLLAPLTGADGKDSTACILHGSKADAFVSWGSFKHDHTEEVDPLSIDGGFDPKFFSLGFVGADRGVSIDICDRGGDDAVRCEMSRLVGHTRKSFIVGDASTEIKTKEKKQKKQKKQKKEKKHKKAKKKIVESSDEGEFCDIEPRKKHVRKPKVPREKPSCDIDIEPINKNNEHKRHGRSNDDLVKKIDTIERDIRTIIARSEVRSDISDAEDRLENKKRHERQVKRKVRPAKRQHRRHQRAHESDSDDFDYNINRPVPVKKHRVKHCPVQHPLLHPQPHPLPTPADDSHVRAYESNLIHRLNRRLDSLDDKVARAESIVSRRFNSFAKWLRRQKSKMNERAQSFVDYLEELKKSVVYTPIAKTEHKLIKNIGKVFRKGKKSLQKVSKAPIDSLGTLVKTPIDSLGSVAKAPIDSLGSVVKTPIQSLGSVVKAPIHAIDDNLIDPLKENVINPVVSKANDTVRSDNLFTDTLEGVGGTVKSASHLIGGAASYATAPISRNDRFDFNDDLRPLAVGPGVNSAADNPVGPVGPVLPPPAIKAFNEDLSLRAAIDYLN